MRIFALREQYAIKPAEILAGLGFYPISGLMRIFSNFFGVAQETKEMIIVFDDYSIITRVKYALFWPHFRLFATVITLELCQS